MEIFNKRLIHNSINTLGQITFNDFNTPFGFIIEDEPRIVKVSGHTRIPAGRYKLGIRKQDTPLTKRHRKSKWYADWFKYHIEVLNVPDFTGIYFHIVTGEQYTEGCQGITSSVYLGENGKYRSYVPTAAEKMKEFYEIVYPILENGKEDVYYTIIDE